METYFNAEAATLALLLGAGLICLVFVVACVLCLVFSIFEDANARGIDYDADLRRIEKRHARKNR